MSQDWTRSHKNHIDGLVQDCSISIANALEIPQFCAKPSIWNYQKYKTGMVVAVGLDRHHSAAEMHYSDVIMGEMAFQITSLTIVYSTFIQAQIKENVKTLRHWPLCGEFTGDRWIPRTHGQ